MAPTVTFEKQTTYMGLVHSVKRDVIREEASVGLPLPLSTFLCDVFICIWCSFLPNKKEFKLG